MIVILTLLVSSVLAQVSSADKEKVDRLECVKLQAERKICAEWTWNQDTKACMLTENAECLRRVQALVACRDRQLAYSLSFDVIYGNPCPPLTVDLSSGTCAYECDLREERTANGSYVFTQSQKCAPLREFTPDKPLSCNCSTQAPDQTGNGVRCDTSSAPKETVARLALLVATTWAISNCNKQ